MPQADRIVDVLASRSPAGERATVQGWIRTRRDSKAGLSFLHLHDGSCFDALQIVAPASLANYEDEILRLTAGCAVTVTGTLAPSQGQGQAVELLADSVTVVGWVDDPASYPISPKRHTFEYLREVAHLRARTNTFGAVARVRHCLAMAIHRYFDEHGFYWVHTPILTASDAEGAGELFRVSTLDLANLPRTPEGAIDYSQDFFGKPAYLTVSGQLNVETYCLALSRVYTFGPTFRAENSNTSRHLSEFWMVEPEIAFADVTANADLAEDLLRYSFRAILDERADDMAFFAERIDKEAVTRLRGLRHVELRAHGVHGGDRGPPAVGPVVRVPGGVGRGPPGRARAIPVRGVREAASRRDQLPQADQGLLHAPERRRAHGGGDGRAGARASARSSAAASARSGSTCWTRGSGRWVSIRRSTGGTATCAGTAPCRTQGSGSGSIGRWRMRRGWRTSATSSRSPGRRPARTSSSASRQRVGHARAAPDSPAANSSALSA